MSAEDKDGNRRTGGKRGRRTGNGASEPSAERTNDRAAGLHQQGIEIGPYQLERDLSALLSRGDGWLRAVPGADAKLIYLKYKFTLGRHAGSYVMAVSALWRLDAAVWQLLRKVEEVDVGTRRATPDRYYGGDHGPSAADQLAHSWEPERD